MSVENLTGTKGGAMGSSARITPGWREASLGLVVLAPLLYLLFLYGGPIRQDPAYHVFADVRTCLGLANFGNVASNLLFLVAGAVGTLWCLRHPEAGAMRSWTVFFAGVALVFFGSAYYHRAPDDDTLVWDRLPMTVAFMGLFAALLTEHMGARLERMLLVPAIVVGIASVYWWHHSGDLRVYVWVQFAPLIAIPFVLATFPGRYTHRHYLLYGLACYALAKVAEYYDNGFYSLTSSILSGHSLKHMVAAVAPFFIFLMLRRREPAATTAAH
jgi:hypothetical protein